MNKLLLLIVLLFFGCSPDGSPKPIDCNDCKSIIGKRFYWTIEDKNSALEPGNGCYYIEDFILNSDNTVDVWRYSGKDFNSAKVEYLKNVCKYKFTGNCILQTYDADTNKIPSNYISCGHKFYMMTFCSYDGSDQIIPLTNVSCESVNFSLFVLNTSQK